MQRYNWQRNIRKRVDFVEILPNEILVHIFKSLKVKDIGRLSLVCRGLYEVTRDKLISLKIIEKHIYYNSYETLKLNAVTMLIMTIPI